MKTGKNYWTSFLVLLSLHSLSALETKGGSADYYTSVSDLKDLLNDEQMFVLLLANYKNSIQERIQVIDKYIHKYESSLEPIRQLNPTLYRRIQERRGRDGAAIPQSLEGTKELSRLVIENPLMAFKSLQRLHKEFNVVVQNFKTNLEEELVKQFEKVKIRGLPSTEDMEGAADGLVYVQNTLGFPTSQFISGKFRELETNVSLDAYDMHFVGNRALALGHNIQAVEWMYQAYLETSKANPDKSIDHATVKEALQQVITKHNTDIDNHAAGDEIALSYKVNPNNLTSIEDIHVYSESKDYSFRVNYTEDSYADDKINFQALCRGRNLQSPQVQKTLTCYYKRDTFVTRIAPMKIEILSLDPFVAQIYELMSNKTAATIIQRGLPFMTRARIVGTPEDKNIKSSLRTSTVGWIYDDDPDYPAIQKLPRVIKQLTGMEAKAGTAAEELQLSSYGAFGGHYDPHMDAFFDKVLTDVKMGGGTAFPRIGIAATPRKGSGVFWYNLKRSGEHEQRTLHGGCPVAYGTKWVANKWIRMNRQMLSKPCGISPDDMFRTL